MSSSSSLIERIFQCDGDVEVESDLLVPVVADVPSAERMGFVEFSAPQKKIITFMRLCSPGMVFGLVSRKKCGRKTALLASIAHLLPRELKRGSSDGKIYPRTVFVVSENSYDNFVLSVKNVLLRGDKELNIKYSSIKERDETFEATVQRNAASTADVLVLQCSWKIFSLLLSTNRLSLAHTDFVIYYGFSLNERGTLATKRPFLVDDVDIFKATTRVILLEFRPFQGNRGTQSRQDLDMREIFSSKSLQSLQTQIQEVSKPIQPVSILQLVISNKDLLPLGFLRESREIKTGERRQSLLVALREIKQPPVVILCKYLALVDVVSKWLRDEEFHVGGVHSMKHETMNLQTMKLFLDNAVDVLVTTLEDTVAYFSKHPGSRSITSVNSVHSPATLICLGDIQLSASLADVIHVIDASRGLWIVKPSRKPESAIAVPYASSSYRRRARQRVE